jgi:hypothetical protein
MGYLLPVAMGVVGLVWLWQVAEVLRRPQGFWSDPARAGERRQLRQLSVLLIVMVLTLTLTSV